MNSRSPGGSGYGSYKFTRVVHCGASVGSLTDYGGVGRGGQGWGTQCLGCPHVDQDLRLLAGVAKPVSVTVCEDSHVSPCVGGRCPLPTLPGGVSGCTY